MSSVEYYNKNAAEFYERTCKFDMSDAYEKFLRYLPVGASILDAGCGVGRDLKYFREKGYKVEAFDASEEMVTIAKKETGLPVTLLRFEDMHFQEKFDSVWASASLLHVPYEETRNVLTRIYKALRLDGILYASYKYGDQKMGADDRVFYNMNEEKIFPYLSGLFEVIEIRESASLTKNAAASSPSNSWLNILCRKIGQ